jgi:hypothetical protein
MEDIRVLYTRSMDVGQPVFLIVNAEVRCLPNSCYLTMMDALALRFFVLGELLTASIR